MRVLAFFMAAVLAAELKESTRENPIRRIVNLLQNMQKEVGDEQARDQELNGKFECYCKKNDGKLSASTEDLRNKIPEIEASVEEAVSLKKQLDEELVQHKADRTSAKESIESATAQRNKEADTFAAESAELNANIKACKSASDAIAGGMAGSFLQSGAANTLRTLVLNRSLDRYSRETLTAFLSTNAAYAPASGEIVGILRQLQEDMEGELSDITKTENDAITQFEGLVSAKEKEIQAATEAIEAKTQRAGETAVEIVNLKNDLEDTKDALGADEKFLFELKRNCKDQAGQFSERQLARSEELVAISETIKILNDDDALDLFKKTLPSPSLMQLTRKASDLRKEAIAVLADAGKSMPLNFITLALQGKKAGFEKVVKMIGDMVVKLGTEQTDDETQKEWCNAEFDKSEDDAKDKKRLIAGLATRIEESTQAIASLVEDIDALNAGIKDLDDAVAEATATRKAQHADFVETAAQNNAAVQLLGVAKNRLNKFYNPTLYKAPERRELTEEERIFVASGGADPRDAEEAVPKGGIAGTGVAVFAQVRTANNVAPAAAPETSAAYAKKDSSGPTALIDKLKNDLEKDMQANEMEEKQAQGDYEEMMGGSAEKRATDAKTITEKEGQKAELEGDLQAAKSAHKATGAELLALTEYISELHGSCDFLIQNFDLRKEARANEIDALKKAKAVLSGADYAFVQEKAFLARA